MFSSLKRKMGLKAGNIPGATCAGGFLARPCRTLVPEAQQCCLFPAKPGYILPAAWARGFGKFRVGPHSPMGLVGPVQSGSVLPIPLKAGVFFFFQGVLCRTLQGHAHWVNTMALSTDYVLRTGAFEPAEATINPQDVNGSCKCSTCVVGGGRRRREASKET